MQASFSTIARLKISSNLANSATTSPIISSVSNSGSQFVGIVTPEFFSKLQSLQ